MSRMPSSFDGATPDTRDLNFIEKCIANCKQQPLIPLGTLATTGAVIMAAKSIRIGSKTGAQKWFRYRVMFQGFTIAALVIGGYVYGKDNEKAKRTREDELRDKAKLREKLWIEELERRDYETRMRKQRAEIARQKIREMEEAEKAEAEKAEAAIKAVKAAVADDDAQTKK